jgi:hypothetical protein
MSDSNETDCENKRSCEMQWKQMINAENFKEHGFQIQEMQ